MFIDAERFILNAFELIRDSPLQLYVSVLPFTPRKSLVRGTYHFPNEVTVLSGIEEEWNAGLRAISTLSGVTSVSWLRDIHIVSGCQDGTVEVYNALTGALVMRYDGHSGHNILAAVSAPDGTSFLSGSRDGSVHKWDEDGTQSVIRLREAGSISSISF